MKYEVNQKVLIETAGGLTPVTIIGFDREDLAVVEFAEGDSAVVRLEIVHPHP